MPVQRLWRQRLVLILLPYQWWVSWFFLSKCIVSNRWSRVKVCSLQLVVLSALQLPTLVVILWKTHVANVCLCFASILECSTCEFVASLCLCVQYWDCMCFVPVGLCRYMLLPDLLSPAFVLWMVTLMFRSMPMCNVRCKLQDTHTTFWNSPWTWLPSREF